MEYILKSIFCLLLLLLFYRLVLQQEVLYRFNRFFLLAAVVGSFLIPLITLEVEQEVTAEIVSEQIISEEEFISEPLEVPMVSEFAPNPPAFKKEFPWVTIAWGIYLLGVLVFLVRFLRNISILQDKISKNFRVTYRHETLVLLQETTSPFSFLKFIFYPKTAFETEGIPEAVFLHEQCHVREKHSWDILLIEFLLIIFWFHPGLYFALQAIRLNHEFIADQEVLKICPLGVYQNEILNSLYGNLNSHLGSHLNFSLTKKRLKMMTKRANKTRNKLAVLALIPVLAGIGYVFAEKTSPNLVNEPKSIENTISLVSSSSMNLLPMDEFLSLYGRIQTKVYENRFRTLPSPEEIEKLRGDFNLLHASFLKLSLEERKQVKMPQFPYARLEKDGIVTYKKWEDLTEEEQKNLGC